MEWDRGRAGDSWDTQTRGFLSLGLAGMTEWSRREGLEFPPPPDELGGPAFPSPLPSPTRRAGSGTFRRPRCARGPRGSWGVRDPPWPPLCGSCRCWCPGPPATWAGPTASEAQRGPRLGLGPITPKAREVGCRVAAREAAAGGPGNPSSRCQPEGVSCIETQIQNKQPKRRRESLDLRGAGL